jgi:Repeat of unknown function (DUF5907)
MTRLPSVGGDNGNWGQLLNDFLLTEHNPDGTLKKAADISTAQATAASRYEKPIGGIPEADLDTSVQAKLNAGASAVPDATVTIKGKLQLAGDLTGTASSPQITAGAVIDSKIAIGANINQSKIQNLTSDLAARYVKPVGGVPLGDLTSSIQASLGKADIAEQATNKGLAGGYASLDGAGKVPASQLPNAIMRYQGVWNASANNPSLIDGSGDAGDVYRVSVAGSQNLGSGSISFSVGDYIVYNPSGIWEKSDTTDSVASVAGKTGVVTLSSADVGLGSVPNTDATLRVNHTGTQAASTISDFNSAADARITLQKGAIGGVASLDGTGKIPGTQLPALAITNTFAPANQAAQLALAAQEGDLAIRTDEGKTYVHNGGVAGTMADWTELLSVGDQAGLNTKVSKAGDTMTGALGVQVTAATLALDVKSSGQVFKTTQDGGAGQSVFSLARINHASQNNEWSQSISNGVGVLANGSFILSPTNSADIALSSISGSLNHLVLKSSGRVGVGTSAPSATLDVSAAGSTTVPQIEIAPSTSVSGAQLLYFATDRPWGFAQHATGAGTALELRAYSSDKLFRIKADTSSYNTLVVATSITGANNAVGIGLDPVNGDGRLQFAAGTTPADGIVAGTDTNLYRQAANTWRTDDTFSAQSLFASNGMTIASGNLTVSTGDVITSRLDDIYANNLTNNVYTIGNTDAGKYHAFSPAPKYIWHDNLRFLRWTGTPAFEKQRVSDSAWEVATLSKTPFNGKESQSLEVADGTTYKAARWTWNNGNWQYGYNLWWLIGFPYIGVTPSNKTIVIESSIDGTNWTMRFSASNQINNGAPALCYMSDNTGDQYVRLTITVTNALPIRVSSIKALSSRQGNQGGGAEYEEPYDWDDDRKITIGTTAGARSSGVLNIAGPSPTTASEGIYFGTDVNLYRSGTDTLRTDDILFSAQHVVANVSTNNQVAIGRIATGVTGPGITFGDTGDTNMYRSAANELKTDDAFVIGSNRLNIATAKTPSSATDIGTTGDIAWDASYVYVCVATNTWKRTALSSW